MKTNFLKKKIFCLLIISVFAFSFGFSESSDVKEKPTDIQVVTETSESSETKIETSKTKVGKKKVTNKTKKTPVEKSTKIDDTSTKKPADVPNDSEPANVAPKTSESATTVEPSVTATTTPNAKKSSVRKPATTKKSVKNPPTATAKKNATTTKKVDKTKATKATEPSTKKPVDTATTTPNADVPATTENSAKKAIASESAIQNEDEIIIVKQNSQQSTQKTTQSSQQTTQKIKPAKKDKKNSSFNRIWELGLNVDANVSNSLISIPKVFSSETLVLDFDKLSKKLTYRGLCVNPLVDFDFFSNVYTKNVEFGFNIGVHENVQISIKKDLFDFLTMGNKVDTDMKLGASAGGAAFASFSFPFVYKINNRLKLKTNLSYYVPIVYVPFTDAVVNARIGSDGKVSMQGDSIAPIYSCLPLDDLSSFQATDIFNILTKGGLDLGISGEFGLLSFLDLGFSLTNIPIVPSTLTSAMRYKVGFSFITEGTLISDLINNKINADSISYYYEKLEDDAPVITVMRPFKFGFWANYRPIKNDLLILTPFIQARFLDSTVANAAGFGFDYALRVSTDLKWFKAGFTTCYIDNVFRQQIDFLLNGRFVQFSMKIATESASFARSWCAAGLGVGIGLVFGF